MNDVPEILFMVRGEAGSAGLNRPNALNRPLIVAYGARGLRFG